MPETPAIDVRLPADNAGSFLASSHGSVPSVATRAHGAAVAAAEARDARSSAELFGVESNEKKRGFTHDEKNNTTVDWWTPKWIFDELGLEFDLDVSAPFGGVPWIPARRYYTIQDDGLWQPWIGRVWLNPPYGKYTPNWLEKMHRHRNGVALVFARTDCRWFHDYCVKADAILFLKGRIQFVDGLGKTGGGGAGAGSMLISWGEENTAALRRLKPRGFLVEI